MAIKDVRNYEEMAMVDIAKHLLQDAKEPLELSDIFKQVSEIKGFSLDQIDKINQLYTDMICCGELVYVGHNHWDLKSRNLEFWDKDGTAFSDETVVEELEEGIDEDLDFSDYDGPEEFDDEIVEEELSAFDFVDDDEDEEFLDEDLDEDEVLELKEEKEYIEADLDIVGEDGEEMKFNQDDLDDDYNEDEEQYNKYMDDYEDMYD